MLPSLSLSLQFFMDKCLPRFIDTIGSDEGLFIPINFYYFQYFMDECLQRLIDKIDSDESLKDLLPSERVAKLVRFRLETQAPYISKWPQALSIQVSLLFFSWNIFVFLADRQSFIVNTNIAHRHNR